MHGLTTIRRSLLKRLYGMSMSKTALGAAVDSLQNGDGSIKSLDDEIGVYAIGLQTRRTVKYQFVMSCR